MVALDGGHVSLVAEISLMLGENVACGGSKEF